MTEVTPAAPAAPAPAAPAAPSTPQPVTAVEPVDNTNVVPSGPADTSASAVPGQPAPAQQQPAGEQPNPDDVTPGGEAPGNQPPADPSLEEELAASLTPDMMAELEKAQRYQPGEVEFDIFDEFGNVDPTKFGQFMADNNSKVFEQALKGVKAYTQAEQIENGTWEKARTDYPELNGEQGPALEKALRGMRIVDVTQGGDGNISRIAKEFLGPLRASAIKAQEDVNRSVTDMEQLSTVYKPDAASPERPAADLMTQLRTAVQNGEGARAKELRHAIRKERIAANNSNVSN